MLDCKVVYSSRTGNTRRLAAVIYQSIPFSSKDIEELSDETREDDAKTYLVGFWTDRESCPQGIHEFLQKLSGKNVLLFGTCGFGGDAVYYKMIEEQVQKLIPSDCTYLGCYMCQGKMPISVREKYQKMLQDEKQKARAQELINNFDRALLHPDSRDFSEAEAFVRRVFI